MNLDEIKITPLLDTLELKKIPDQEYFSDKYKDYISNSRLSYINPEQGGGPEQFFKKMPFISTPSLQIGSAVHELILQPDLFYLSKVDKPTGKVGTIADILYKPGVTPTNDDILEAAIEADYYGGKLSENMIIKVRRACRLYWDKRAEFEASYTKGKEIIYLDNRSRQTVLKCVEALRNNKAVQDILHPKDLLDEDCVSEMEQGILLNIKVEMPNGNEFILKLKSKLDNYTIDTSSNTIAVNDVKTLGKILPEFPNNVKRFHYSRELALYSWLFSLCAKKFYNLDNPTIKGNYLVVSTIPSYYTKVFPLTENAYREGWQEFVKLIKMVASFYDIGYRLP